MSLDAGHVQQLIGRLRGLIEHTGQDAQVESMHHLRTHTRRLEAILQAPSAMSFQGKRKLLKRLQRLRRRAGKVRDLDVQLEALASLRFRGAAAAQRQLRERLRQKRVRQAGKLPRRLNPARLRKLQRGLEMAEKHLLAAGQPAGRTVRQAVATVQRRFAGMKPPSDTVPDSALHAYRIQCKHLRYRLEAVDDNARTRRMMAALKRIQDAVGTWHDWLTLTQNAEKLLPEEQAGTLLPALRQATRRRRGTALRVIAAVRKQWGNLR